MSTDFIYFHGDINVADAIEKLRWIVHIKHPSSYVYVVDSENRLIGVLNMAEQILADPDTAVDKVMLENLMSRNFPKSKFDNIPVYKISCFYALELLRIYNYSTIYTAGD